MSTELDLDDVAATSPLAVRELAELRTLCARQRAWIDEVMAQEFWEDVVFEDSVIFRPAPFEDKRMSDDKSGQCEHGYYGLCPRCYDNLRADRDRYSDMLDISQGVVRELRARVAELEAQIAGLRAELDTTQIACAILQKAKNERQEELARVTEQLEAARDQHGYLVSASAFDDVCAERDALQANVDKAKMLIAGDMESLGIQQSAISAIMTRFDFGPDYLDIPVALRREEKPVGKLPCKYCGTGYITSAQIAAPAAAVEDVVREGFTLVENKALSTARMALAHATTTHGELYRHAYESLLAASNQQENT